MAEPDLAARIVYRVDAEETALVRRGLIYRRDAETALHMDVYGPRSSGAAPLRPAVLFVHGGPIPISMPPPTDWGVFQSYGELAAASGFIGVVFNHRLHSPEHYPLSLTDLIAALDYVRVEHVALGVDPDRIGLWVYSGAGPHVTWLLKERPAYVKALAAFYALLDFRALLPSTADEATQALYTAASPATYVRERAEGLPMFVARAGLDAPLFNAGIDAFVAEATAGNAWIDVANHAQGPHGFDVRDDSWRSRQIIRSALQFMQAALAQG